jgi:hypothetical protein
MAKLYLADLKKYLRNKSKEQLVDDIVALFKSFQIVQEYYAPKLNPANDRDILEKYRKIIKDQFYPERGFPKLKYSVARKAITDYQKLSDNHYHIADLMLSYVEYGIMITNEFGDIDEQFYDSMESMFEKCLKYINRYQLKDSFKSRCGKAVADCDGIGWGFADGIADIYGTYMGT